MKYNYTKKTNQSFLESVKKIKEILPTEGFGVLTEIDVKATMKKKLDIDYDNYVILGACNPKFAHKALQLEYEIGLMLPCNIIIYEKKSEVFASAVMPSVAMGIVENNELKKIAQEVENKLKRIIDSINDEKIGRDFYICSICKLKYKEKDFANKCEQWCMENGTCNLDIIKNAEK